MGFVGRKPTNAPLTSSDLGTGIVGSTNIADGTIANADIANSTINLTTKVTGTLPVANGGTGLAALGTANQVLAVNSGASALEFQSVSSDFVLLATTDITSSTASVSFDGYFSATYKNYQVIVSNFKSVNDNVDFSMRFRISNADVTTSNYVIATNTGTIANNGGTGGGGGGNYNLNRIQLIGNTDNSASDQSHINFMMYDPLNTSSFKNIIGNIFFTNDTVDTWYIKTFGARLRTSASSALSGFSFYCDSGNISTGNFKLYGIK